MTAKKLREKFEEDLRILQLTCPHKEVEDMEQYYAPGHFLGMVKVCKYCEKIIK